MNGGSKCLLKNHDALLSFSQRWRSALSRLLPLPHLRLARCMPSRWFGRSREFTSWGARPRCARRGRNPKATSMIHSHPCYWDEDASPRVLLCPARPQKADVRRERVRNADAYVIRPFGSPCLCNYCTFQHLRFTAPEFWAARWNRTRLHTSHPQQPAVEITMHRPSPFRHMCLRTKLTRPRSRRRRLFSTRLRS